MHVTAKTGHPDTTATPCLIVGVYEGGKLTAAAQAVDKASHGAVKAMLKSGDIKGKVGQTVMLHHPSGLACDRLLLVGCGKDDEMGDATYHKVVKAALSAARGTAAKEAFVCLGELEVTGRDAAWKARLCAEAAAGLSYRYDQTKSKKDNDLPPLSKLHWRVADATEARAAKRGIEEGTAIAAGMKLAKDLGNLPGNICTPTYLGEQAKALGNHYKNIKVTVLDEKAMEKLSMGSLLS
ncbi:MAG TPA: M17 family peptidase N-terminal domain-containing protein, partial [Gammaproteobacteria bacterium]